MFGVARSRRSRGLGVGPALAVFGVLATAGCGHTAPASQRSRADTPDGRLTRCLIAAGYAPSESFSILKTLEHARLVAAASVRDGKRDRQVVIYRADSDGRIAGVGNAMASSGLRVEAIARRRLVGVSSDWSPEPRRVVLERCASVAAQGRPAPPATNWF